MKYLYFILFYFQVSSLSAQTYLLPQLSYNRFLLKGNNWIDKWYTFRSDYWEEGHKVSVQIRHCFSNFYIQSGINYGNVQTSTTMLNTKLEPEESTITGAGHSFSRLEVPFLLGKTFPIYKKWNFRFAIGATSSYRFLGELDRDDWYPDNYSNEAKQAMVRSRIYNRYVPFAFDVSFSGGLDIGKFSLDIVRSQGLTNLANDVQYDGKIYPLVWKSKELSITLGWKFRIDKNRPRKHKKNSYF
jgi:hypothetical protein